jgi:hypothetical protein
LEKWVVYKGYGKALPMAPGAIKGFSGLWAFSIDLYFLIYIL